MKRYLKTNEMDKILETYDFPKLNQEESENLIRQITPSEIEAVIIIIIIIIIIIKTNLPTNKSPGLGFTSTFYQTFQEELTPLLKIFHKIQKEGRFQNSFYEVRIILIPKPDKDTANRKLKSSIPDEHRC